MIRTIATVALLSLTGSDAFQVVSSPFSRPMALHASTADESSSDDARRAFMATGAVGAFSLMMPNLPAHAADGVDYKAVASDIMDLVKANPDWGPTFVRLAWHSSGTYDKVSKTGGSGGGTIRFKDELAHGGNAGLAVTAVEWLEPIHAKYADAGLSYADLYTLAGVASIKQMGGPAIGWSSGRTDQPEEFITPDGRLPNADSGPPLADKSDADHLRTIFYRMGFNDQEIVALSGAHALGRCHETASGYVGPWTFTPTTFNNAYFTLLTSLKWIPKDWSGPPQYVDGGTGKLMMLPSDLVLLEDKPFLKWVNVYAKDGAKFDKDFAKVFQKLEELGTKGLKATEWI
ncbi:c peroxidase, mitochondrial [Seminavis robusta]|uniref:Cytochrome c peroxidase, mitochondrial n=1 Tax=Seminavis robusta TaxID=568900 RepID=A0A9N8ENG9_9STRA|nr:c peroxidase, mitochondrial [Seminavis robusta]|eukprot:Sro1626_g286830.1 c peroxidase, mitochondrial (346) ;mRNA; f:4418-5576